MILIRSEQSGRFLLSRRAHLLTTSSSQSPFISVSAFGENCVHFLAPPLPTKFATLRGPLFGGGIACGNRALCEADAASAEALWTMLQLWGVAVIVHAVGKYRRNLRRYFPTASEKHQSDVFHCYGYRFFCDTHFLFAKKKQKQERKDGENEWQSTIWKPRWSAEVRDGLRLPLPLI